MNNPNTFRDLARRAMRSGGKIITTLSDLHRIKAYDAGTASHFHEGRRITQPKWEKVECSQRDEYAELAGY